jgi:hypothetical protein
MDTFTRVPHATGIRRASRGTIENDLIDRSAERHRSPKGICMRSRCGNQGSLIEAGSADSKEFLSTSRETWCMRPWQFRLTLGHNSTPYAGTNT